MKTIQNILIIVILLLSSLAFSQNDLKARIEFEEAEKQFNENNFSEALRYLENTESLIGKWTPKVSFMKIESLNKIADFDNLESDNSKKLMKEVKLYMDFCNKHKESIVMEKFKVVYTIDENIKQIKKQKLETQMLEYTEGYNAFKEKNYTEAIKLWNQAAAKGNSKAMYQIGAAYYYGDGVPKDYVKSTEWYQKSAVKGNSSAMYEVGSAYYNGIGVTKDLTKAMDWYLKSANNGNKEAIKEIADAYYLGNNGFTKDYIQAMEWYLKLVDKDDGYAMCKIGRLYDKGNGIIKDSTKAMEWYLKSAAKGNTFGMYCVGINYCYGDGGVIKDYNKAMEWFLKGGEKGDPFCLSKIGSMYQKGEGVTKDYSQALEWYLKATEKNDIDSIKEMAIIYEEGGYGVKRDKKKAKGLMAEYEAKTEK
ncbi:tetratricopeptide repeat protein [Flavobacterium nackdongense]|uniref:Sel1 repeat family protein n=1 Tax=Flavobacterium nackdongense TaxID=2547394 RepID=A0A4P6YGI3_9FLAO|nr:SEL1-like repeat protein [Flavobacterium nackdongense]QBN19915.1 hypothetical protein E1750_14280 [Flavobacterium nackdongense]